MLSYRERIVKVGYEVADIIIYDLQRKYSFEILPPKITFYDHKYITIAWSEKIGGGLEIEFSPFPWGACPDGDMSIKVRPFPIFPKIGAAHFVSHELGHIILRQQRPGLDQLSERYFSELIAEFVREEGYEILISRGYLNENEQRQYEFIDKLVLVWNFAKRFYRQSKKTAKLLKRTNANLIELINCNELSSPSLSR